MGTPRAAMSPICQAYGSPQQRTAKRGPHSRCASLTASWSVSATPWSLPPWTTRGGLVIVPSSSMARGARCPIRPPSRTRSANRPSRGRGGSCTCSLRIIPSREKEVVYHRSPDLYEGERDGIPPGVSRPHAARTAVSGHDLLLAVATAPSCDGPCPSPAGQALHEAFPRPKAVSWPHPQTPLRRLCAVKSPLLRSLLVRRRSWLPRVAVAVKWTPSSTTARIPTATMVVGWVTGISGPTAILVGGLGGNCNALPAGEISRKRTARPCMANGCHLSSSCGRSAL